MCHLDQRMIADKLKSDFRNRSFFALEKRYAHHGQFMLGAFVNRAHVISLQAKGATEAAPISYASATQAM
jgi:hypothetical protein